MFLSIVIPVYNTPVNFLRECLESLKLIPLSITSEIILVNDGSKDEETLKYLSSLDETKYLILHRQNGGPGFARNEAIKKAKGKYIFPLDADDILNDDFDKFINYLQDYSDVDVLYGNFEYFGDINKVQKNYNFDKLTLWYESNIPACSFFKRSAWDKIKGYDESLKTFEDYDFWIQCAVNNFNFSYLPYSVFKYRKINNGESLYQKTRGIHKEYFKIVRGKIPSNKLKIADIYNYVKSYYERKKDKLRIKALIYPKTIFAGLKMLIKICYLKFVLLITKIIIR